ncbi:hypothetical protein L1887_56122 [Cichorium endivia]|nr:hypothetical protein L1887_56122 [Cichorium endivia]
MNAWLPQASYPCGNFSDTSSFKFRRSKGSLGHAFTVRIRTGNQNQTSFYPSVPHEISVLVELILGHLRYLLTDVPPQPNSPPDNVFRPDRPAEAGLGSKKRGIAPLPIHGIIGFPLSVPVLSWLFDARGRPPKEPFPVRPPAGTRRPALAAEAARAVRRQPTGSGLGPPCPALRANPFPEVTDPFCRLPLAYIVPSTRGCSPWRPDAVMSTTGRGRHSVLRIFKGRRGRTGQPRDVRCSSSRWTLPPTESSHLNICYYHQDPHRRPLRPGSRPRFSAATAAPSYSSGPGTCPRRPGVGRALKRHPFSGLVDSADERFARQYRCGPPPEFPLASPRSGIVHHLSGPDRHCFTLEPFSEDQGRSAVHPARGDLRQSASLRLAGLLTR